MPAKPADKKKTATGRKSETRNAKVGVPHVPAMYQLTGKNLKSWRGAEARLEKSRNYWICTARPDGRPHSIPVWGFWYEGALYFSTAHDTRKAKNLAHNPAVSVHLESGDDVVILEGRVEEADLAAMKKKLNPISKRKYNMPLMVAPGTILYRLRPRVALAWTEKDFPNNATRWEFTEIG